MKCLDNIYTKQIKYNSPVLYQLESLKKEYEKLLKVSNEIINTGSFIEECYFENQSAVLSDNEITFSGNLKFKTDSGNYFQNIPSSLKLNFQDTGEIVESWQNKCGFERNKVIYDADSEDSDLNWGYTSGLPNGEQITHPIDPSFKGLKLLINQDYRNSILYIDLTIKDPASGTDNYISVNCYQAYTENSFLFLYQATCTVSGDRQRLTINLDRLQSNNWSTVVKQGTVKKIIGVK